MPLELVAAEVPSPATVTPAKRPSGAEKRRRRAVRAAVEATHAETWPAVYLDQYAKHGNLKRAAATACVEPKDVRNRLKTDDAFAAQVASVTEDYRDELEYQLVQVGIGERKGNPLALIARLNAERPQKYLNELRVNAHMKAVVSHVIAPEAASDLLRLMIADATPVTLQALSSSAGSTALPAPEKQAGHNALVLDVEGAAQGTIPTRRASPASGTVPNLA